jgi:hypothetical protein
MSAKCSVCGSVYTREQFYQLMLRGQKMEPGDIRGCMCAGGETTDLDVRDCAQCGNSVHVAVECTHRNEDLGHHDQPASVSLMRARSLIRLARASLRGVRRELHR